MAQYFWYVRDDDSLARAESIYRDVFRFHHLTIEDCREARNQPKVEEFPNVHRIAQQCTDRPSVQKVYQQFLRDGQYPYMEDF